MFTKHQLPGCCRIDNKHVSDIQYDLGVSVMAVQHCNVTFPQCAHSESAVHCVEVVVQERRPSVQILAYYN